MRDGLYDGRGEVAACCGTVAISAIDGIFNTCYGELSICLLCDYPVILPRQI